MKRKNFVPNKNSYLCSEHFTENDFVYSFGRKSIKDHVVPPNIFDFSANALKHKVKPRELKNRDDANIICCEGTSFRINEQQPVNEPENCPIPSCSNMNTLFTFILGRILLIRKEK